MIKTARKGIAPLYILIMIGLALILVYAFLFIPIPAFTRIRMSMNYFFAIILWIIIQVFLIYGYFELGKLATRGFHGAKSMITKWSMNVRRWIVFHS